MSNSHTLILVRHGESQWNHLNLFAGWVDVPLSTKGEEEALKAGEMIMKANLKPDSIHTSKLSRSCESGNIILKKIGRSWVDVSRTWRLNERHYGKLQGESKSKVLDEFGKEKYMFWRRAYNGVPPLSEPNSEYDCINDERYKYIDTAHENLHRGESLKMVTNRLLPYFDTSIKHELNEGKIVLVVAHGSTIRALVKHLSGVSDDDIAKLNIPTGIPMVFELDSDMKPVKEYYYLDPEAAIHGANKVANQGF